VLDKIWTGVLDFTSKLVIPDWGSLVALIPVALAALVVLWLLATALRFATVGPTRRGRRRIAPIPPPGIHAPGPSFAPILAAIGLFLLLAGLVFGGLLLPIGAIAFVVGLLYWGREGLRDYDHLAGADRLPAVVVVPREPPPGIHMPGPSFRPIIASLALAVLFFGLVFGGWLIPVGIIFLVVALLGWLSDARAEYRKAVEADASGHLEPLPRPAWPKRLLGTIAALIVVALILNAGILPPKSPAAASGSGGSGGPAPSGSTASGAPGVVSIVAQGVKFTTPDVAAPANQDFTINFDNKDPSTPHDVDILGGDGSKVFDGQPITGPKQTTYQVKGLAAGSYKFECSIHPSLMSGTLKVG
jgi:plastocyanin